MKTIAIAVVALAVSGCVQTGATRTSADTAIVRASAAPICGSAGSAKVAEKQAAIETLKAGYDRYIIVDAAAANNVRAVQMPGSYHTSGTIYGNSLSATTTYRPGPTVVAGRHDTSFAVRMFKEGDAGASRALSARETLGPDWAQQLKRGSRTTCAS